MLQMLSKTKDKITVTPLPDYVTVKEIVYSGDRVARVVFRDADDIIKIVNAIECNLRPLLKKDCPSCSTGLCPDGKGGYIPCTICGNTNRPKK